MTTTKINGITHHAITLHENKVGIAEVLTDLSTGIINRIEIQFTEDQQYGVIEYLEQIINRVRNLQQLSK